MNGGNRERRMPVPARRGRELLSVEELAARAQVHPQLLEHFVTLGLLDPAVEQPRLFRREATLRIQRIFRLRRHFNASYEAVGLILELLDRIEQLERELQTRST